MRGAGSSGGLMDDVVLKRLKIRTRCGLLKWKRSNWFMLVE
jgi:hypothetical protein